MSLYLYFSFYIEWGCSLIELVSLKKVATVTEKSLRLALPYLRIVSFLTSTNLEKSIKGELNFFQLKVVFKIRNKLCNEVYFKDPVPELFTSGIVCKSPCQFYNEFRYGEWLQEVANILVFHLWPIKVRNQERIVLSVILY